jgi:hypothetical protein
MYSYRKLSNLIEESKFNVSFSWLNLQHLKFATFTHSLIDEKRIKEETTAENNRNQEDYVIVEN